MAKIHRLPCEVCKEDTLHVGYRCNTCGNIFVSPSQQMALAHRRISQKAMAERGTRGGLLYMKHLLKQRNEAVREDEKDRGMRVIDKPARKNGYGYGRNNE